MSEVVSQYKCLNQEFMVQRTGYLLFLAGFIIMTGCGNLKSDNDKSTDLSAAWIEIDSANALFIRYFNTSDSTGLAGMFTDDGKSLEPNESAFVGTDAIRTHYSKIMNASANKLELETTGLWGDEQLLAEEGNFIFTDSLGNLVDKGKYIVLWKKVDNTWKLFRDIYNSDLPLE